MKLPDLLDPNTTEPFERRLARPVAPINEVSAVGHPPIELKWTTHALPRRRSIRGAEWYFECAFFGLETLRDSVEVDANRRGGIPVLKGTRVTVAETLAEIAESSGVLEVAENFDLDAEQLRTVLNGLSLLLNQPFPK